MIRSRRILDYLLTALKKGIVFLAAVLVLPVVAPPFILLAAFYFGLKQLWLTRPIFFENNHAQENDYTYTPEPRSRTQRIWNGVQLFLKITLFPLYVLVLGLKVMLMSVIYPKNWQGFFFRYADTPVSNIKHAEQHYHLEINDVEEKHFKVLMPHGIQLHTCEFSPKTTEALDRPYVIYFSGNNSAYNKHIQSMLTLVRETNATVVGFHHSGFGCSGRYLNGKLMHVPVTSSTSLVEEGVTQVQRLLDKGVPANHITLYGHSLGGAISSLVAFHFHKKGLTLKVVNDRSFRSLTRVVMGWILPDPKSITWKLARAARFSIAYLLRPIVKAILVLMDCEMEPGDAFTAIPSEYRKHFVIRDKETVNGKTKIVSDEMIFYAASMHRHPVLRAERKAEEDPRKKKENKVSGSDNNQDQHTQFIFFLKHRRPAERTAMDTLVEFVSRRPCCDTHGNWAKKSTLLRFFPFTTKHIPSPPCYARWRGDMLSRVE